MPKYIINRTIQPADFEPIHYGVEHEGTKEEAFALFNELQDDIIRSFNESPGSSQQFKRGGTPPKMTAAATLPPKK